MKKRTPLFLTAFTLLITTLACNLPALRRQTADPDIADSVEKTLSAEVGPAEIEPQAQAPPATEPSPSMTPTITETPTVTPTFTPSIPMARVSQNTNCRTGPGTEYDLVYIFMVGDEAEIIARSSVPNYFIIKVPDGSGRVCWLWMQYGEKSGSTDDLPQRTPPPTPTPAATATPALDFTLSYDSVDACMLKENVFVRITNTGGVEISSRLVTAEDQDTAETTSSQSDGFSSSPDCISLGFDAIGPGGSAYAAAAFTPPTAGHTINLSVKACAGDGLAGPCVTKSITVTLPNVSDVNLKENFAPVDAQEILELVSELPITTWNYTEAERDGRHIGPMAQDFNTLFGVGEYDDSISAVDSYGVALAAIQALSDLNMEQAQRIESLEQQNEALLMMNEDLHSRVDSLESVESVQSDVPLLVLVTLLAVAGIIAAVLIRRRSRAKGRPPD